MMDEVLIKFVFLKKFILYQFCIIHILIVVVHVTQTYPQFAHMNERYLNFYHINRIGEKNYFK